MKKSNIHSQSIRDLRRECRLFDSLANKKQIRIWQQQIGF